MLFRSFSPFLLTLWTLIFLAFLGLDIYNRREEIKAKKPLTFLMTANLEIEKRKLALGLLPIALNFPWSASFILHPTQILLDPGLPVSGGSPISLTLFNPGGLSGVPFWIISPMIIYLVVILFSNKFSKIGVISGALLSLAILFSPLHITGHGSIGKFWAGSILIIIEALLIPRIVQLGKELIPNLKIGRAHV